METYILKTKDFGSIIEQTYYKRKEKVFTGNKSTKENIESSTRSRAISRIKEICYCNNFDYFFTFTLKDKFFRDNTYLAINLFNKKISYYSKLAKLKGSSFKYIYVYEYTKKGAVHVHRVWDSAFMTYIQTDIITYLLFFSII